MGNTINARITETGSLHTNTKRGIRTTGKATIERMTEIGNLCTTTTRGTTMIGITITERTTEIGSTHYHYKRH